MLHSIRVLVCPISWNCVIINIDSCLNSLMLTFGGNLLEEMLGEGTGEDPAEKAPNAYERDEHGDIGVAQS